jgi:hypothetical protein
MRKDARDGGRDLDSVNDGTRAAVISRRGAGAARHGVGHGVAAAAPGSSPGRLGGRGPGARGRGWRGRGLTRAREVLLDLRLHEQVEGLHAAVPRGGHHGGDDPVAGLLVGADVELLVLLDALALAERLGDAIGDVAVTEEDALLLGDGDQQAAVAHRGVGGLDPGHSKRRPRGSGAALCTKNTISSTSTTSTKA